MSPTALGRLRLTSACILLASALAVPVGAQTGSVTASSPLGSLALPATVNGPGPTHLEARLHLDLAQAPADGFLVVGWSSPAPQAHARLDGLVAADGTPLPASPDGPPSGGDGQPRLAVSLADARRAAAAGDLTLQGTTWTDSAGRFRLEAVALATAADGTTATDAKGAPLALTAATWVGPRTVATPLEARVGTGPMAAFLPAAILLACAGTLGVLAVMPRPAPRIRRTVVVAPPQVPATPRAPRAALPSYRPPRPRRAEYHPVRRGAAVRARAPGPFPDPTPRPRPPAPHHPDDPEPEPDPEPPSPMPPLPGFRRR